MSLIEAIAGAMATARIAARKTNDERLAAEGLWPSPHFEPPRDMWAAALITALIEAGYAIVPVEPTEAMLAAGQLEAEGCTNDWTASAACLSGHVWSAMLAMSAARPLDSRPIQCEPMHPVDDDGWCEWIHPLPGYLMQCCDCGLVHEMEYAIVPSHENCGDAELNEGETKDGVIIFRARRALLTAALDSEKGE